MLSLLAAATLLPAQQAKIWSLTECLEHARSTNIPLLQAQLATARMGTLLDQARAARLPNLNAGVGFGSNFGYAINPFTNEFSSSGNQNLNGGIQSSVTLYNGNAISNGIRQAEINDRGAELDVQQAEYDLVLNVALAYLDILRLGELAQSAQLQLNSTREQRDRTNKLVEAGILARADLYQLDAQVATDELAVVNAENQLETAHLTLMQIMRLDPGQPFGVQRIDVEVPDNDIFEQSMTEIYKQALNTQPSIQSAELGIRSAELGEKIAQASFLPSVTASGSIGTGWASGRSRFAGQTTVADTQSVSVSLNGSEFQSLALATTFPVNQFEDYPFVDQLSDNLNASVNVSLNIPIYNRHRNTTGLQLAEIQRRQAELLAEQQRLVLEQTIQQAYVSARSAYGSYQATLRQLSALELTYTNTEKQYNLGVVNSVDFLLAKNNFERARNDLVRTKYDYIFRAKVLDFYMGKPLGL
ncbi:MAG: TolC family protein [Bacteroidia bacterium]